MKRNEAKQSLLRPSILMYVIEELSEIFLIPPNEETQGLIPPVPTAISARPISENSLNINTVDKDDTRNRQCRAELF
jgi:hypothetical protein